MLIRLIRFFPSWILTFAVPIRITYFLCITYFKMQYSSAKRQTLNIKDSVGIKLLTRLRLGFSHLREHKLTHGFRHIKSSLFFRR